MNEDMCGQVNLSLKNAVHVPFSEDSCGFEHVFVGETKKGREIMGLHNWVQFYLQEKQNNVDYKGYKARKNKGTVRKHCMTVGIVKILNTSEFYTALKCIMFPLKNKYSAYMRDPDSSIHCFYSLMRMTMS